MKKTIVNIIASIDVGEKLNLITIAKSFKNCEYEPEIYFALIYRLENPKISLLINHSGKVIFNGSRRIEDIYDAKEKFFSELRKIDYNPIDNKIKIHNVVVLVNLEKKVTFNAINYSIQPTFTILQKKGKIIIKNTNPKFTAMVFPSGKCLIVGLKDETLIDPMLGLLKKWIDSFFIEIN